MNFIVKVYDLMKYITNLLLLIFFFSVIPLAAQVALDQPVPSSYVYYPDTRGDEPILIGLLNIEKDHHYFRVVWPGSNIQIAGVASIEPSLNADSWAERNTAY